MKLVKTISIILSLLLSMNIFAHNDDKHINTGISKAMSSGVKGICNGDPVSYIIRQHPELLKHKRDKTLRQGIRNDKYSLQGCIECHAAKENTTGKYHDVDEKGQFCSDCHEEVGISLDCFECHRTKPVGGK
ncbi:Sulfite reduction-associated complex DsrMKJOP multiheme protein DsrJ (=HmeF) [hydrothermal vent metagenome]|uniref:Sulfite reduction-associated complex DsrMKJOP multiheme protein DsrJ (=HmeF) n=1 Tax=hydrothermal vent metagenome TaxID=652676 RepID=A0A1W1BLX1_9ZZZZ